LYNYLKAIMLIISRFFFIVLSLTRYLYNKYKSIYTIIRGSGRSSYFIIISIVTFIVTAILTPLTIL
jgi:hypothetical protein